MKNKGKFLQWLKRPRGLGLALIYVLTAVFIAAAVTLSALQFEQTVLRVVTYVSYGLAAIFLGYTVYTIVIYAKPASAKIREKLLKHKRIASVMQNYDTKTLFFPTLSLVMNVAFAIMNGVSAIKYSSLWYGTLAGYYTVLILFRIGIIVAKLICDSKLADDVSRENAGVKIYLASGAFLVVLGVAMATAISMMVIFPKPALGGEIMAISTAAFTFYTMTMSIVNLVKAKRFNDCVTQALRNLNLATSCMSMLSLTVSLISTFGKEGDNSMSAMKAIIGLAVCLITLAMATFMIIRASKTLKKGKGNGNE